MAAIQRNENCKYIEITARVIIMFFLKRNLVFRIRCSHTALKCQEGQPLGIRRRLLSGPSEQEFNARIAALFQLLITIHF